MNNVLVISSPNRMHTGFGHNITQLLGCIPWDHVLYEHKSPLILGFLVYGGTLMMCILYFLMSSCTFLEYYRHLFL